MIDPGVIAVFVPVIALMIPIVAILVRHQQRMAEIIHSGHASAGPLLAQIEALTREVAELRQIVHQQAITIDSLASQSERPVLGGSPPNSG